MKRILKNISVVSILLAFLFSTSCSILKKSDKVAEISENDQLTFKKCMYDASKSKMQGDVDQAISLYSACISIDPSSAVSYYEIASLSAQKQDYQNALIYSAKSVELQPNNYWYNALYADLFQSAGLFKETAEAFERMIKVKPDKIELYIQLSSIYTAIKKTGKALDLLTEAENRFGINDMISVQKEKVYLTLDDYEKAENEIQKLSDAFPGNIQYLGMLAEFYASTKQPEKALKTYNYILELDSTNGVVHLSLSDFYRSQKDYDKAFKHLGIAFYSESIDVDIKVQMLASFIGLSQEDNKLIEQAYTLINLLLEIYPDDAKVHTLYADYLIQGKEFEQAKKELQMVVKTMKDKYLIWEQLLLLENDLSDFEAMYTESKEALEYFPTQPLLHLFNGISASELKNYKEAILSLSIGVNLVVDNDALKVQFYTYLADAFRQNGSNEDSDKTFDKLLKIDPSNKYALNNYSYYLSLREEKLEQAEEMSKKIIDMEPNNPTYLDTYAWVLYKRNKFAEAKKVLQNVVEKGNITSAVIIEHYGDILFKLGEKENAISQWTKAKEIGKGSKFLDDKVEKGVIIE